MATQTAELRMELRVARSDDVGNYVVGGDRTSVQQANGTSAGQADLVYSKRRTVTNDVTPDEIDLDGSLVGPDGEAVAFASVTIIRIRNLDDTQVLSVGGGSNAPSWATFPPIGPGGELVVHRSDAAGYPVTAGTGDILRVATDGGTSVPYEITIVGRSA